MPGFVNTDERRRQNRTHWPRIDPAIRMAADRVVNRAVVEAGTAANTPQHVLKLGANHFTPLVVEQHHVILARPVRVVWAARTRRECRINGCFLPRGGTSQNALNRGSVFKSRNDLLQTCEHNMRLRYCLREIAVAFVSHDDRGACLRDQKVRARDADVGIEELLSQLLSRFVEQFARFFQRAIRVSFHMFLDKSFRDFMFQDMNGRRDDVARRFFSQLDDVFAEIRFDRFDAVLLEEIVQPDFFRDHRLALGHGLHVETAADIKDRLPGILGRRTPMHMPALLGDLPLESFKIIVEMRERVIFDVSGLIANLVELRKLRALPSGGRQSRFSFWSARPASSRPAVQLARWR